VVGTTRRACSSSPPPQLLYSIADIFTWSPLPTYSASFAVSCPRRLREDGEVGVAGKEEEEEEEGEEEEDGGGDHHHQYQSLVDHAIHEGVASVVE